MEPTINNGGNLLWFLVISAKDMPEERFFVSKKNHARPLELILPFLRMTVEEKKAYNKSFKNYFNAKVK